MNPCRIALGLIFFILPILSTQSLSARDKAAEAETVRRLIRQLGSEDFEVREKAVRQLVERGQAVMEALESASHSKDPEIARLARECINRIDPSLELRPQVMAWIKQLRSPDEEVRDEAVSWLRKLGPKLAPFVEAVADVLDDPNVEVRNRAACVLGAAGASAEKALPKLLSVLKDKTPGTKMLRVGVMQALEDMGTPGRPAVPILLQILETEEPEMQRAAAVFLGNPTWADDRVGPALSKALCQSKDWDVQFSAAQSLAYLRKEPEKTISAIVQLLNSRSFKTLEEKLDKRSLVECLGEYGTLAEPSIPCLIRIIQDWKQDELVRQETLRTLIRIGPAAQRAVPRLKNVKDTLSDAEKDQILRQLLIN